MKKLIAILAEPSPHATFHCAVVGVIATGGVMLATAAELGPVQVFLVPLGLYTVCLGMLTELACALRFGISAFAAHLQRRARARIFAQ